jgi:glycosyltransferase involved in cell wall biosynthesis
MEDRRHRLILLTQWFDPEPTMKGLTFAQRLGELGFDVEVVTGFPNYPGGKVYDGYRIRLIRRERHGGVAVTRLALYPSHDSSRIGRILNYTSFCLSALLYLLFLARRADVVYAYHPPLTVGFAAAVARLIRRMPVVLDIQDLWPDTLKATGMIGNARVLGFVGALCRWTYRRVDRIVLLSNGFRKKLIERGVPEAKLSVIYNWADEAGVTADPSSPDMLGPPGRFRVLFAGNMGKAQGLDSVLDAAALVAAARSDVEFCFLGAGLDLERLRQRAADMKLDNVRFLPRVPMAEVGAWLAAADCLLVHLRADPLFEITVPSKTQAYMAAGKPIIMAVPGDAAELITRSGGGLVVPPQDAGALASAVMELADMPAAALDGLGVRAHRFYVETLSFDRGTRGMADLLLAAARQEARP